MTNENKIEETADQPPRERRAYEAPVVRDFFQPLVVLGTATSTFSCAAPKPPKH